MSTKLSKIVSFENSQIAAAVAKPKPRLVRLCDPKRFSQKTRDRKRYVQAERKYYKKQAELLLAYKEDEDHLEPFLKEPPRVPTGDFSVQSEKIECNMESSLENISFACNFLLLIGKIVAAVLSDSLSILSSMVDSLVDNTTNVVIAITNRAIRNRDLYHYPRGRTRLEPLALIIISAIMGIASLQVLVKTVEALVADDIKPKIFLVVNGTSTDVIDWRVMGVMVATIVIKICLCVLCYVLGRGSPTVRILAQDHRNDCLSNSVAIACGVLGQKYWKYLDPIGAIVISIYIASSWLMTGRKQIAIISGRSAPPYFISRIIKICMDHHAEILHVDAVTVYHFGTQFLVEVDIVVDPNTTVQKAHDISDPLQRKIEHLPYVERAFVHVEYQTKHSPAIEHKTV